MIKNWKIFNILIYKKILVKMENKKIMSLIIMMIHFQKLTV